MSKDFEIPKDWSFDVVGVAKHFDDHVRHQLPWYDLVTRGVAHFAKHYATQGGSVWDVGSSTGNVVRAMNDAIPEARGVRYFSIEKSPYMANAWRGPGELFIMDAREVAWREHAPIDFAAFFLVLMFIPPVERVELLSAVYDALRPGGAIVVVDRTIAARGYAASVIWRLTLAEKIAAGATWDDVIAKELSLAGVQRPIDPMVIEQFNAIEWFRFGDFAAWVIEKPEFMPDRGWSS